MKSGGRSAKRTGTALRERVARGVFFGTALVSVAAVALICVFLLANGIPAIGEIGVFRFLAGREWSPTDVPAKFGILPMILGSLYVTAGAVAVGVPIGVLSAVFLAYICPKRLYRLMKPGFELLAGIPSVVYGFFGMAVLVTVFGNSVLSAALLLGLMILPTVIQISESSLRAVPEGYIHGALALGSGRYRAIFRVALPAARSGLLSAVVLGVGRAAGETMAVIMVAGNQARMPSSLLRGVRTLTANIVIEMGYASGLHGGALIGTGVVLLVFILLINLAFSALRREGGR
ncbi:MAG: phosphate ABC transporter permease subunit PstC [Oscillospiraceae bacterium]|jgi:phosphate transport system permease protein|nr:phosphate ABC transporter permease subunit PstC [Oscillospiraceae bacterium]